VSVTEPVPSTTSPARGRSKLITVGIVTWAVLTSWMGAALLPPHKVTGWFHSAFGHKPSRAERTVDDVVAVARDATTWMHPPTVYGPSVAYFKNHFAELDPSRGHPFPAVGTLPVLGLPDLAQSGILAAGAPLMLAGDVASAPTVITPMTKSTLSWAITIKDSQAPRTIAMCRVPLGLAGMTFAQGDRVTIAGLVIADGGATRFDGRGSEHIFYLACSAIAHSTQLVMIPPSAVAKKHQSRP
jgi:hypothetical protein